MTHGGKGLLFFHSNFLKEFVVTFVLLHFQVYSELEAIIDKLAKDVQKGTLPKKIMPKPIRTIVRE